MDIYTLRQQLKTQSIYDIPLRVTYYARVSSESDEQLNSLGNQVSYYENLIKQNAAWTFVPGYIDEGISGISAQKREQFNQMIADAKGNRFDLVITKEISRFARNTLDSIQYTRQLLSSGVGVFFQNDGINTLDEDAELRLAIMSSIAQDELRKLSSRIRFGHQQAIKSNVVLGNNRIFGYKKDNKKLVIDEEEAPMVRELFQRYATNEYSLKQLETMFWEMGYRNHNGNKIAHTTLSGIISNPKYKGWYVGNKVQVIDMFTKKQKFLPQSEWVMFKDESGEIVPAIVSEELWEQANQVLRRRSEDVKNRQGICNHPNLLTGKLYCTCCGKPYYRRESKDRQGNVNSKWVCSGKINNGAASCPSFPIYEEEIKPILFSVFQESETDVEALMEEYLRLFQSMESGDSLQKQIDAKRRMIEEGEAKKHKLLEFNLSGKLSDEDFLSMVEHNRAEINEAKETLKALEEEQFSNDTFRKHMEEVRRTLELAKRDAETGMISKDFVQRYIDRIFVTPEGEGTARLEVRIFTGKTTEKYLEKLRNVVNFGTTAEGRTGHTSKKMIEAYENGLK